MAEPQAAPVPTESRGLIGWFARNHVAANLLMFCIIGAGIWSLFVVKKESFPDFGSDEITVSVQYRGAAPQEVSEGVVVKIEQAIESIQGIGEIRSTAMEGMGRVVAEIDHGYDINAVASDIKVATDGISTFPAETERPSISKRRFTFGVLSVQVHGNLDEASMKELAGDLRGEIAALPEVPLAEVTGSRPFEISIEVSEQTLRQYGLTLSQVAQTIRQWSIDLPGGSIQSEAGQIRLRTKGQAYTGAQFERIVLLTQPDGTRVRLGDIATIRDGFVEVESYSFFNGERSFGISVLGDKTSNEIKISEAVHRFIEQRQSTLPEGVELTAWSDRTFYLKGRLNLMLKNMALGALLVLAILGIFLHMKIAAWVVVGLPVAFLGAMAMLPLPYVDVSINIMSLFAFILVLGIVVDDAIIIAESAYTYTEQRGYNLDAIVAGARRVAIPATFGVLTTIVAFVPMLLVRSRMEPLFESLAWVVVFCLLFSLIESKLVLPSHLAIMRSSHGPKAGVADWVDRNLKRFSERVYKPFLRTAITYRYATLGFFVSLLILVFGVVTSGTLRYVFFPEIDNDFVRAEVELHEGAPDALILDIVHRMDAALREINEEIKAETGTDVDVAENMFAYVSEGTKASIRVELAKGGQRPVTLKDIEHRWREKVGEIAGTKELKFYSSMRMGGQANIELALLGNNYQRVERVAEELADHLRTFEGVFEVRSSSAAGPEEIKLRVKPEAEAMGITLASLARQVREAFYGAEVQRIQRDSHEIRVMVRYPRSERQSVGNLENMWFRMPDGRELPFDTVAEYDTSRGYNALQRLDGRNSVTVRANADTNVAEPTRIVAEIRRDFIPDLLLRHPGVTLELTGSSMAERMGLHQLGYAFLAALFGIYALLAIPLRSYIQPLIIMSAIPFGIVGAVVGHMILGLALNSISIIGFIALSGVVVNDSLIMVDFVNRAAASGLSPMEAAIQSGAARLRPILLTSLTTFFGLAPMIAETSMQAQMVIPMAVSLAFGILFATVITLVLVPCLYNIVADLKRVPVSDLQPSRA